MWLDDRFGTEPALTVVGFFLGVAAGFRELLRATKPR
jgi:F0F1-type ATP synthase assembly protein I